MSSGMEFPKRMIPPKDGGTRHATRHQGATEPEAVPDVPETEDVEEEAPLGWRGPQSGEEERPASARRATGRLE